MKKKKMKNQIKLGERDEQSEIGRRGEERRRIRIE